MTATFANPAPPARNRFGCFTALGFVTAGFIALIALIAVLVFGATAAPVSAANAFFRAAATDGASAAYATTAPLFRTVTSQSAFETVAQAANLSSVENATWNARGTLNGVARISGHLHYRGGATQTVAVQLSKTDGKWRVLWLDVGPNAVAALAATDPANRASSVNGATGQPSVAPPSLGSTPAGLSGPGVSQQSSAAPSGDQTGMTIDVLNARTMLADGTPALRGTAIGAFCRTLFQQAKAIRYDRIDCPISLGMAVGAQTRCIAAWDQHTVGMTATYQGVGPDQKPNIYCKADDTPMS